MDGTGAIGRIPATGARPPGSLRSLRDVEPHRGITLQPAERAGAGRGDFATTLADVLQETNAMQLQAEQMLESLAAGTAENLHDVVIAQQEAAISMRLVQEIRDKLLQGYQEIMRMQV